MKKLNMNKTTRKNYLTYGLVIVAFIIIQIFMGAIPATLNLEQQSYFALGYYQMGAKLSQEKKERSAASEKAAAEE